MPNRIYIQPYPSEQAQFGDFLGTTVLGGHSRKLVSRALRPVFQQITIENMDIFQCYNNANANLLLMLHL
jgi:hypothetical protein